MVFPESIAALSPFGPIEEHKYIVFPDSQPIRVSEEPVCIYLFHPNPVLTTQQLRPAVHDYRLNGTLSMMLLLWNGLQAIFAFTKDALRLHQNLDESSVTPKHTLVPLTMFTICKKVLCLTRMVHTGRIFSPTE